MKALKKAFLILVFAVVSVALTTTLALAQTLPTAPNKTENGLREGKWVLWFTQQWKPTTLKDSTAFYRVISYQKGKPTGIVNDFYLSGKKQWEGKLLSDNPEINDGLATWYHENGQKSSEVTFVNGKKQGEEKTYYESGKLESLYFYSYTQDVEKITFVSFYENGNKKVEGEFKNRERNSVWTWYRKDNYKEAKIVYDFGNEIESESYDIKGNIEENWQILNKKGEQACNNKDYNKASSLLEKALLFAEKEFGQTDTTYIFALTKLAEVYKEQKNVDKADTLYLKAINLTELMVGKKHINYANALFNLADLYDGLWYKRDKGLEIYLEIVKILKEVLSEKHPDYAIVLKKIGAIYRQRHNFELSEIYYEKLVSLFGKDEIDYNETLLYLAEAYDKQSKYDKAELIYSESLKKRREILKLVNEMLDIDNDSTDFSYAQDSTYRYIMQGLAKSYMEQSKYKNADSVYKEIAKFKKEIFGENTYLYAQSLVDIGFNSERAENFSVAEELYLVALSIQNLLYEDNLKIQHSLFYKSEEEQIFYQHNLYDLVSVIENLVRLYQKQNLHEKAEALIYKTLASDEISNKLRKYHKNSAFYEIEYASRLASIASSLENINATLKDRNGNYVPTDMSKAEILFKASATMQIEFMKSRVKREGDIEQFFRLPTFSQGITRFDKFAVNRYIDNPQIASFWYNLRLNTKAILLHFSTRLQKAVEHSGNKEIISLYGEYNAKKLNLEKIRNDYRTENYQTGKREEKLAEVLLLQEEIKLIEQKLKEGSKEFDIFTKQVTWQDIQKKLQPNEAAIEIIATKEGFKDYYTFDYIGKGIQYQISKNGYCAVTGIVSHKTPAYKAGLRIRDVILEINGVTTKDKNIEELKELMTCQECNFKIYSSQTKLTENKLVRSDSVFSKKTWYGKYFALIVTPDTKYHPSIVVFDNGNELENGLKAYRNKIKFKLQDSISYNLFWKPIAQSRAMQGVKKVYISLDGIYNQLSINTLYDTKSQKYIYENIDVQVVSNTKDILLSNISSNKPNKVANAVLVGNLNYTTTQKETQKQTTQLDKTKENKPTIKADIERGNACGSPLPATQLEIDNIYKLLKQKKWELTTYTHNFASESVIKAIERPTVLHIATHGFFEANLEEQQSKNSKGLDPFLRSGILLSGSCLLDSSLNSEDNILTAREVLSIDLYGTDLVVLSACETGLGDIKNGEGVYGLQRSFILAGVKTLIVSLWKVDDAATQELMNTFYELWLSGKPKREAFKTAQLKIKEKYKSPYYWGAFVMVGD